MDLDPPGAPDPDSPEIGIALIQFPPGRYTVYMQQAHGRIVIAMGAPTVAEAVEDAVGTLRDLADKLGAFLPDLTVH